MMRESHWPRAEHAEMIEKGSDDPDRSTRDLLHENVQRSVAVHTLRKIRGMVDAYDEEDRANRRRSRRVLIATAAIAVCLLVTISATGAALPRLLTAALVWLRG